MAVDDTRHLARGIEDLGKADFEDFSYELIEVEALERHPGARVLGPRLNEGAKDGGSDVEVTVTRPPITAKDAYQAQHTVTPLTGNNATGVWTELFHFELDTTGMPISRRLRSLAERLADESASARVTALGAIELILSPMPVRFRRTGGSAPIVGPTPIDCREGRVRTIELLAARFADADDLVSTTARRHATRALRTAFAQDVGQVLAERIG